MSTNLLTTEKSITNRTSGDGCDVSIIKDLNTDILPATIHHNNKDDLLVLVQEIWDIEHGHNALFFILLSKLLQRYLEENLNNILSHDSWFKYLEAFKQSMWPDAEENPSVGLLKEELKLKTHKLLSETFPKVLNHLLGDHKYNLGITTIINSFDDSEFIRNSIYHLSDLILREIFKHVTSDINKNVSQINVT